MKPLVQDSERNRGGRAGGESLSKVAFRSVWLPTACSPNWETTELLGPFILKRLRVWDKTGWFPFSFHEKHNSQKESQALASFRTFAARPAYSGELAQAPLAPTPNQGSSQGKPFPFGVPLKAHKSRARRKSYQKTQPKWLSLVFEAALVGRMYCPLEFGARAPTAKGFNPSLRRLSSWTRRRRRSDHPIWWF